MSVMPSSVIGLVREFLDKMGVNYYFDEEEQQYILPYILDEHEIMVVVRILNDWILAYAPLLRGKNIPSDILRTEFFARLLRETLYLHEINYGLTDNNDVIVHSEIYAKNLTFETFKGGYNAVLLGAKHFYENILPDFK